MKKHAYLIVAHNNWNILNKQMSLIDNEWNDIFLLIDKRARDFNPDLLYKCAHSKVYITERINVYWAEYSQVQAYINLLSSAFEVEQKRDIRYTYFHFNTGTDLPLKSQTFIHGFCDNSGKEFIGIVPQQFPYCTNRTKVYWVFLDNSWFRKYKLFKIFCYTLAYVQRYIGINRLTKCDYSIYNGWANCSISHDLASFLLGNKDHIHSLFSKTLAPDELWVHTLAYNSRFKDQLYDVTDLRKGSMRYIDWQRGRPYTWGGGRRRFGYAVEQSLFIRS